MTTPIIKIKVLPKPVIKGKMDVHFPANVQTKSFLTVTKANGTYTFGVDYSVLTPGPIADPTRAFIAIQDETSGVYRTVSLASFVTSGLDADLQAIAALTGTGLLRRTGTATWTLGTPVANSELATMANNTFKGNVSGATAAPSDLTPTQVTAALPVATTSAKGLAPVLPNNATLYLDGTGNYTSPGSGGGLSPEERAYWNDRAALLDPAAYVFWKGLNFSVTVPAGEMFYVVNAWATKIQGSNQWYHRDIGTDECFPVPPGTTISSNGLADSFLYVCRPALVTGDPAYADPKGLYYTRLNALRSIALSQVSASQAAGAAAGTSATTFFPPDFNDGMLAQVSVMDSAWCILLDALGRGALNTCIEISDLHQFRPTKTLLTPFRRAAFPSIQCVGGSVSGNATDTIVGGSGVVSYYKLPDTFRTQSPLNAYRAAVLADNPKIYYTFDEVSGTTVTDAGSAGLNGTYLGTPVLGLPGATADGRYGVCFNNSADAVSIPASTNFDFAGGDFTYEAWVKFDALPTPSAGYDPWIVNAFRISGGDGAFQSTLLGVSNNKFNLLVTITGGTTLSVSSSISLGLAQYYHVIAGRSGGNLFIRVVGKETRQTIAISSNIIPRGSNAVWLGVGNTGGSNVTPLTGRIDEFALYNSALSDARADAHHAATLGWG
ncbi:LamG domain-containing protein [Bradyrhizobium australafricanum]|uniref:LamG domain-containing protein n=1 Tax=Bradyrhizobium australafricanum TaxID=2821406 RepID=UPI001CE3B0A9|nr:LamG domain-containing protein [Bradyrhizobium australafricanum]MCA6102789.1 LamG domain-containing protein [Bradyrhizobium australafricanum]